MLGPNTHSGRSQSRRLPLDKRIEQPGMFAERKECELCESATHVDVKYGLRVCESCDEELLP